MEKSYTASINPSNIKQRYDNVVEEAKKGAIYSILLNELTKNKANCCRDFRPYEDNFPAKEMGGAHGSMGPLGPWAHWAHGPMGPLYYIK